MGLPTDRTEVDFDMASVSGLPLFAAQMWRKGEKRCSQLPRWTAAWCPTGISDPNVPRPAFRCAHGWAMPCFSGAWNLTPLLTLPACMVRFLQIFIYHVNIHRELAYVQWMSDLLHFSQGNHPYWSFCFCCFFLKMTGMCFRFGRWLPCDQRHQMVCYQVVACWKLRSVRISKKPATGNSLHIISDSFFFRCHWFSEQGVTWMNPVSWSSTWVSEWIYYLYEEGLFGIRLWYSILPKELLDIRSILQFKVIWLDRSFFY